ncbi:MAG: SelL-related redox protein [Bacteroidota bacterium]
MEKVQHHLTRQQQQDVIKEMYTQAGETIANLSFDQPILMVFLRHFGCTFCREALADIASRRREIEVKGTKIVFVHMSENKLAERYFHRYQLEGVDHVSDPECKYYAAFGLTRGTFTQIFGLQSWIRGFQAGILNKHLVGSQLGDGFQMPGVFVIRDGMVKEEFVHKKVSDRPDYTQLVACCSL